MKAQFRRSTSKKALKKSGYFNAHTRKINGHKIGGNFIFNKYAPTDKRAVIPPTLKIERLGWCKGVFGQPNPDCYAYISKSKGWQKIN